MENLVMKKSLTRYIFCALLAGTWPGVSCGDASFNYAEALQKCLYFYEAQQSGPLSPNNRVSWRGPACLTDGQDIGRDLAGGWFDAGDHWTANLTMAFSSMTLAFSAIECPEGWIGTGQMDELLESLIYVNQYFLKCVLNPDCSDPSQDLEVVIGCGGHEGVEEPRVHAMWGPAEVAHLMTNRPTFRVNKDVPAGDIPAAMSAAMAAAAIVIRDHAHLLQGKHGYGSFDSEAFSNTLLDQADKLLLFARAQAGPVLRDDLPEEEEKRIRGHRSQALRSDGQVVNTGYRSGPFDKIFTAATFLQRAHQSRDPQCGTRWLNLAQAVYNNEYKTEKYDDWWKDYGAGNFGKVGAFNMMRLLPNAEPFHRELQLYSLRFCKYRSTPGGLHLREWHAHEYGSLRHANNAAVIALYYSDHVADSPPLSGNTWWKSNLTNRELQDRFLREAKHQVDYALGANPYGRSYLVGFGNDPFNHPHHRGAYGAWAGFEHFIPGKADDRNTSRHVLYGALIAGPDHNDVFLCGKKRRPWLPKAEGDGHEFYYQFPNRAEPVPRESYQWDANDQPVQDVMDSQFNEVALDYNAGFTASLAWLCAHGYSTGEALPDTAFPPPVKRHDNNDLLATDREFFVSARLTGDQTDGTTVLATVHNRSRWPARVTEHLSFRYYFTLDGDMRPDQVQVTLKDTGQAVVSSTHELANRNAYVEVSFPNDPIHPGNLKHSRRSVALHLVAPQWNTGNDWSCQGLSQEEQLYPHIPIYQLNQCLGGEAPFPIR